jgi:histidine ammonia-lyase
MTDTITIDGFHLTPADVERVARGDAHVALAEAARDRVRAGERELGRMIPERTPIYGVTTGFGALVDPAIRDAYLGA